MLDPRGPFSATAEFAAPNNLAFTIPLHVGGSTLVNITGVVEIRIKHDWPCLHKITLDCVDADGNPVREVLGLENVLHDFVSKVLWNGEYDGPRFKDVIERKANA